MTDLSKDILEGLSAEEVEGVIYKSSVSKNSMLDLHTSIEELKQCGVSYEMLHVGEYFKVKFMLVM